MSPGRGRHAPHHALHDVLKARSRQTGAGPGGDRMARDFKRMTRIELESELSAERAAARRSHAVIVMMAVLAVLGFMMAVLGAAGALIPVAG